MFKTEAKIFLLASKSDDFHHFCHILTFRRELINPAHVQGQRTKQRYDILGGKDNGGPLSGWLPQRYKDKHKATRQFISMKSTI